ncbi:MAG: CBS domain-containing protein [Candidatus Nanoarchaeia archaeon]
MATVSEIISKKFVKLDANEPLKSAIAKLIAADERYGLIFENKKYKGMLDRVSLIKSKIDLNALTKTVASYPPTITKDASILNAAKLMLNYYPCLLPVLEKNGIIGVVRPRDLLLHLAKIPALRKVTCAEMCTEKPLIFEYSSRIGNVINIMKEKKISHVPIVNKKGDLVSVFTITDLYKHYLPVKNKKMRGIEKEKRGLKEYVADKIFILDAPVGDLASIPLFTVTVSDNLMTVLNEMYTHKISDVIVVQNKKPIGIITTYDLLKLFSKLESIEYWPIQFIGCEALPGQLFDSVREQVAEFYEKALREFIREKITYFKVHIKRYEKKETKRQKYSVHLKLALASKTFTSEYAHFDLNTAISWALKALNQQLLNWKERLKDKSTAKKGRRAIYEHFIQREAELIGREKIIKPKLIKRK